MPIIDSTYSRDTTRLVMKCEKETSKRLARKPRVAAVSNRSGGAGTPVSSAAPVCPAPDGAACCCPSGAGGGGRRVVDCAAAPPAGASGTTGVPHWPQKRASAGSGAPQCAQALLIGRVLLGVEAGRACSDRTSGGGRHAFIGSA